MEFNADSSYPLSVARFSLDIPAHLQGTARPSSSALLFEAIDRADTQRIAGLLATQPQDLSQTNTEGQTPLHRAIGQANQPVVGMLLATLQPHELDAKDQHGHTALMLATAKGSLVFMEALIQAGASLHVTADDQTTALMHAVAKQDTRAAMLLLSHGAHVNHVDGNGRSALMHAAQAGDLNTVTLLLNFAANVDVMDNTGDTAYGLAERYHHSSVMNALHCAANFLRVDDDEGTAMGYWAA